MDAPGAEGSPQASAEPSISAMPTEQPAATSSPGATLQGSRLVLATSAPDSPGMDALAIGNLAGEIRGGTVCFWLEPTSGSVDGPRTALLWPFGFGALADPLRLTGPDAQVIAAVGDAVELGGGGMPEGYLPTATQDPCGFGSVFSVSSVASVNGRPVDIGGGSLRIVTRPVGAVATCPSTSLGPVMLVLSDGALHLRGAGRDWDVTWPSGFEARAGNRVTIIDDRGQPVMRQGDEVATLRATTNGGVIHVCGLGERVYP